MGDEKFSTTLGPFGSCGDRFCLSGYREGHSVEERIKLASRIKVLDGIELHYPMMFKEMSVGRAKELLQQGNLECSIVSVTVWSEMKWGRGSLTNPDGRVRTQAVETIKEGMDIAKELGASRINLWLGQDGFDYPFQVDYQLLWNELIDGLKECAKHNPEIKICLEYKPKEPRSHLIIPTVGKSLYTIEKVGFDNVGVNLDFGHAMMAFENPAESAVLLNKENRLFHLHFNDNYREFDWDMIAGSVHFWELLEFLFWLQEIDYQGWYSLDIFPYREDPMGACEMSIENIKSTLKLLEKLDRKKVRQALKTHNYLQISNLVRQVIYE